MTDICQVLDWDTAFFGQRIARVHGNRLDETRVRDILVWCVDQRIDCLYFLADSADGQTSRLAETYGFHLMDIRVTLEARLDKLPPRSPSSIIRPGTPDDLDALRLVARSNHQDSRFYYDPGFSRERCDALYETWLEKSFHGYADIVLAADLDGQAVGYITCKNTANGGDIGLLGVSADYRGRGLGRLLIDAALDWCAAQGHERVSVVTQGRNANAQRTYQRCGFLTQRVELWYHRWFTHT